MADRDVDGVVNGIIVDPSGAVFALIGAALWLFIRPDRPVAD